MTVDKGLAHIAYVSIVAEIGTDDLHVYLENEDRGLADFLDLITENILTYEHPESPQLYTGPSNHPVRFFPGPDDLRLLEQLLSTYAILQSMLNDR
jgi:hypothetical protein